MVTQRFQEEHGMEYRATKESAFSPAGRLKESPGRWSRDMRVRAPFDDEYERHDPETYGGAYYSSPASMVRQSFAGVGPKGWRRRSESIQDDLYRALAERLDLDASGIEIEAKDDEVILSGVVMSRSDKRLAEETAAAIFGVGDVVNKLKVDNTRMRQDVSPPEPRKGQIRAYRESGVYQHPS